MTLTPRTTYLVSFIIISILLGFAFYLQNHGVVPCPLCILQRYTLVFLAIVFFCGALFNLKKFGLIFIGMLSSLIALTGSALAARQVWLQHLPPNPNADCGASLEYMMQVLPWNQLLQKVFTGSVECSQIGWRFIELSLAEWSLLLFVILFLVCLWQTLRALR